MINDMDQDWTNEATKTIRALKFITSPTQIYLGGGGEANKQTSSL
jgi:hypothetical protein